MNRKAYFPHTQTDIRKILVVCAITFLALTRREGFPLPKEKVAQIDYLSTEYATELPPEPTESTTELAALDEDAILEQLTTEILQIFSGLDAESSSEPIAPTDKEHDVANDFVQLCETSATFCEKTFWNGTFTPREKSEYFGQITTIVSGIDTIAQRGKALEQVFSQILINQAKGNRRGSSGRTKLTMNLGGMEYDDEFRQVFTHEVGHIVDLGSLQGKNKNQSALYTEFGKKAFALDDPSLEYYKYSRQSESIRKSWVSKTDFCSGYGMTDPFEDFAECHNLYLNHHDLFIAFAGRNDSLKAKFNYFANLYRGEFFSDSTRSPQNVETSWRAWDTTRIQE